MVEFIKYTIAGVVTTLMNYVIYSAGLHFHMNYLIANTIAWCFAVLFAYFMNRNIVFQSKNNSRKEMILFVTLRFLTLLVEMFVYGFSLTIYIGMLLSLKSL